eukprot:2998804-Prymnesium_polylepis.1
MLTLSAEERWAASARRLVASAACELRQGDCSFKLEVNLSGTEVSARVEFHTRPPDSPRAWSASGHPA